MNELKNQNRFWFLDSDDRNQNIWHRALLSLQEVFPWKEEVPWSQDPCVGQKRLKRKRVDNFVDTVRAPVPFAGRWTHFFKGKEERRCRWGCHQALQGSWGEGKGGGG